MRKKSLILLTVCFALIMCFFSLSATQNDNFKIVNRSCPEGNFNHAEAAELASSIGLSEAAFNCFIAGLLCEGLDKHAIYSVIADRRNADLRTWLATQKLPDIASLDDVELRDTYLEILADLHGNDLSELYFEYEYLHGVEFSVLKAIRDANFNPTRLSYKDHLALKGLRVLKVLRIANFNLTHLSIETCAIIRDLITSNILRETDFLLTESESDIADTDWL